MSSRCLLDTNHASEALAPLSHIRARIVKAHRRGIIFGVCHPVLCELEAGFHTMKDPGPSRREWDILLRRLRIWPFDLKTSRNYGEIYSELRKKGRTLSTVDIMIAAFCRQEGLTLLTADHDFEALPDLKCENWLLPPRPQDEPAR